MGRKKNKTVINKHKEIERREPTPFDNIVLKEKKESEAKQIEKKIVKPMGRKPSEIVQGYNPSISFADILYSYESTGNPYSMPKPKASKKVEKEDFGSILDKWEGRGKSKAQKRVESVKNSYKPTKSFADILSSYEKGIEPKKESIPTKKKENIRIESFFREEDEDNKVADGVTWSILGGKQERKVIKEEAVIEKKEIKRSSSPYKPQKDFSQILEQYENKAIVKEVKEEPKVVEKVEEKVVPISEKGFFREEEEGTKVAKNVSWSIIGGRNEDFVRAKDIKSSEQSVKKDEKKTEFKPSSEFSTIFNDYQKKEEVKTFDEILKEKGDNLSSKPKYTISKLRAMAPQATLDLHGETQQEAETLIKKFIAESVENGLKKVCIITGKGLHSEGGEGVLRAVTEKILDESGVVSEKNNAPLNAGGSGALWIILKG